jgi:membrane AbrB-like protein
VNAPSRPDGGFAVATGDAPGVRRPAWRDVTPRAALKWAVIVAVLYFSGTRAESAGLPAPHLFAALIVGLILSLGRITRVQMPTWLYIGAQAVTGVVLGTYLSFSALKPIGANWFAVVAVTALTLGLSLALGVLLARRTGLDRPTAALGMIAGGSAGIVATSDDLGADARVVAFTQYLRLALVVLTAPLLVRYVLHPAGAYGALGPKEIEVESSAGAYVFCFGVAVVGALVALRARIPAAALIGPLLLAAALTGSGVVHRVTPPEFPRETAFTLIGLHVGMRFTPDVLRRVRTLAPHIFGYVVVLLVTTGLLAWGLSAVTNVDLTDAYLATTPGGINAVLVTAFAAGAHTSFVFAVQTFRLFVMVLAAPPMVRWLVRRQSRAAA